MNRAPHRAGDRLPHGLVLHLRARHVGWALAALVVLTAASWWAAGWLSSRPYFSGALARPPVVGLAPLLAATITSATLAGADADLDDTTSQITARTRTLHASTAALLPTVLLATVATETAQTFGSHALARNTLGLVGAVLLTSTFLSTALTWLPAFTYVLIAYLAAPRTPTPGAQLWAWTMQPGGLDLSWVVAFTLLAAGVTAYARHGPLGTDR